MALYVKFDCATCENENCTGHGLPTTEKVCDGYKHAITNASRIRAMSDEELAEWLGDMIFPECVCCPADNDGWCKDCKTKWLDWLKKEAGE